MIEWMYEPKYKKVIKEANISNDPKHHKLYCRHFIYCEGVFDQLARYTIRYKESDLHLGLYSSLTSANNLNLNLNQS